MMSYLENGLVRRVGRLYLGTYQLHIIANGIQDKRSIIVFMVLWPQSWLAITGASCVNSSLVEGIDSGPV
jgi:hypothetical protein